MRPLAPLPVLVRMRGRGIDAWLGAAIAAGGVWSVVAPWDAPSAVDGRRLAAAIVAGGLAQAAAGAIGPVPVATGCGTAARLAWLGWPVGAAGLAAAAGRLATGRGPWELVAVLVGAAATGTALVAGMCVQRRIAPADALSIALVAGAAAAAAVVGGDGGVPAVVLAAVVWAVAAGGVWSLCGVEPSVAAGVGRHAEGQVPPFLQTHGPVRGMLWTLAMLTSLTGMVFWFFLDPSQGAWYPLLAATWFVCLAVPQAVGLSAGGRAGILARSAAGADSTWRAPASRRGRGIAVTHAAVLGWPAVVAVGLSGSGAFARADMARWPATTLAVLAVATLLVSGVVAVAVGRRLHPRTTAAVAFAGIAAVGGVIACILPWLPVFAGPPPPASAAGPAVGIAPEWLRENRGEKPPSAARPVTGGNRG